MNHIRSLLLGTLATMLVASGGPAAAQHQPSPAAHSEADRAAIPRPVASYDRAAKPVVFELFRGNRIFLSGVVNGTPTVMMLDSGASSTVLDKAFADKLGIKGDPTLAIRGAGGSIPGFIAPNVAIKVGGMTLKGTSVMVMDLAPISQAIGRPIPVILGHDAMDAGPVRIDFPARSMSFLPTAGFTPPKGATELVLGHDGPFRSVPISLAGLPPVNATFDIGNAGTVLLSKPYWESQPAIAGLPSAASQIGGVGGLKPARRVTLPEISFAGQTFKSVPATLNEDATALPTKGANVGIDLLKAFVLTADYRNDRIYLERSGDWTGFRRERAGVMFQLAGDRLRLVYVSPDGPVAAAGFKTGDELVAVDGQPVGPSFFSSPQAEWTTGKPGTEVELTRADGSKAKVTLRDYY